MISFAFRAIIGCRWPPLANTILPPIIQHVKSVLLSFIRVLFASSHKSSSKPLVIGILLLPFMDYMDRFLHIEAMDVV